MTAMAWVLVLFGVIMASGVVLVAYLMYHAAGQVNVLAYDMKHKLYCTGPIIGHCNGPRCPYNPDNHTDAGY